MCIRCKSYRENKGKNVVRLGKNVMFPVEIPGCILYVPHWHRPNVLKFYFKQSSKHLCQRNVTPTTIPIWSPDSLIPCQSQHELCNRIVAILVCNENRSLGGVQNYQGISSSSLISVYLDNNSLFEWLKFSKAKVSFLHADRKSVV